MNCWKCDAVVSAAQRFCEECGAALEQAPDTVLPGAPAAVPSTHEGSPVAGATLPGTPILLGDGETIWRQYQAAQLGTREQGEGTLYVTDSRVVFYARTRSRGMQRSSSLVQQTKLEHITGLAAYVSRKMSLGLLILTVLMALATLGALATRHWLAAITLAAATAASVFFLRRSAATYGSVGVAIHSSATQASPIGFGQFGEQHGLIGNLIRAFFPGLLEPFRVMFGMYTAFDVLVGFPGQDSDQIIAELGALIFDLQARGDHAAAHWGVTTGEAGGGYLP